MPLLLLLFGRPCNIKHINRLKCLIHACAIWTCVVCIVVTITDNKDLGRHLLATAFGCIVNVAVFVYNEIQIHSKDIFRQEVDDTFVSICTTEMQQIKSTMVMHTNWETHSECYWAFFVLSADVVRTLLAYTITTTVQVISCGYSNLPSFLDPSKFVDTASKRLLSYHTWIK